jgi:thiol:disulfide interchange protein DsbC
MSAADPRVAIAAKMQGVKAEDLHATPIPGIYELLRAGDAAYVSSDGKYAIIGDLYETGSNKDLTENRRRDLRLKLLAAIPEAQMVVFGPLNAKHTITVFTDMDCAYCRKLHSQISDYNRLGIKVRYIAYPRSGPNTASWSKAEQVWCAADRKTALTEAKLGKTLPNKICPDNPVAKEYDLGQQFNLQGTPTLILGNGEMVAGYLAPADLAAELKDVDR